MAHLLLIKEFKKIKSSFSRTMATLFKPQNFRQLSISEEGDSTVFFLIGTVIIISLTLIYFSFFRKIQRKEIQIKNEFERRWK